tara:strand:- start:16 stop:174 length:159 start_codon:yes stop_codon:yes gene_type:complete
VIFNSVIINNEHFDFNFNQSNHTHCVTLAVLAQVPLCIERYKKLFIYLALEI